MTLDSGPMNREGVYTDTDCLGGLDDVGSGIASLDNQVGGSGYTDGSYVNKPLQGGMGSGATATFVVTGGSIISISLVNPGSGYVLHELVTVNASDVGGTGSGFNARIASLAGTSLTLSFMYNNTGGARTIHIGAGVDNYFKLVVNGVVVADSNGVGGPQFYMWHIMPVNIIGGINYINIITTGDTSISNSVAMVVYDNTAAQISAATDDDDLNILFKTSDLRGDHMDAATCPDGYSLDASGGVGSYTCVRIDIKPCNTLV